MATPQAEQITIIKKQLVTWQNEKYSAVSRMEDPGFLESAIMLGEPEQINEKIKIIKETMPAIIRITQKQQARISYAQKQFTLKRLNEIKKALINEIAVCEDIQNEQQPAQITKKIEELGNRIRQTMGLIRSFST